MKFTFIKPKYLQSKTDIEIELFRLKLIKDYVNELNEIIGALLIFEKKGKSFEESSALNKLDQKLPIILKKSWDLGIEKSQEVISLSEYS